MPRLFLYVFILVVCALAPAGAAAAPTIDGIFPTGPTPLTEKPGYLTLGPDGNIWVAMGTKVARVTPQGNVQEFDPGPGIGTVIGITGGPDGNLWVTGGGNVGKFSPTDPTTTGVLYAVSSADRGITTGPDNNLWAVAPTGVVRFAPADPEGTDQPFGGVTGGRGIARGPNNTLVVGDFNGAQLVSYTTAGVATPIPTGGGPQEAIAGPGGQIGYTNPGATPETVGRVTPPAPSRKLSPRAGATRSGSPSPTTARIGSRVSPATTSCASRPTGSRRSCPPASRQTQVPGTSPRARATPCGRASKTPPE